MKNPFSVVKDFEDAVAEYCGAPYCVAVNSCTNALFLCLAYHNYVLKLRGNDRSKSRGGILLPNSLRTSVIEIPKHTYIGVAMQIKIAGYDLKFRDENWKGIYKLEPFGIFDAARRFTSGMFPYSDAYGQRAYICVSFHWQKILGIQQGGAILHNDPQFDAWARRARFDGRTEGVAPKDDKFEQLGWHMYLSPEIAAAGLVRLHHLPKHNADLPTDDYPDLSKLELFK